MTNDQLPITARHSALNKSRFDRFEAQRTEGCLIIPRMFVPTTPAKAMRASVPLNWRVTFFAMQRIYDECSTSLPEQLDLLSLRGVLINDKQFASSTLAHVGYFRLRPYWHADVDDFLVTSRNEPLAFERVVEMYDFDRQLRIAVLECLERVEVSVRASFARSIIEHGGPLGHWNVVHTKNPTALRELLATHRRELGRSANQPGEISIQGSSFLTQPVWASCEVMSFGTLSKWFKNVLAARIANDIARTYHLPGLVMASWLHHLNIVRNVAAHHSRLWNRQFAVIPRIRVRGNNAITLIPESRSVYNSLAILQYLRNIIEPHNEWASTLCTLIDAYKVDSSLMGFPDNWKLLQPWCDRFASPP